MAPSYGHGARRTAAHRSNQGGVPPHISSTNSNQRAQGHYDQAKRERDHVRQTQRKRDRLQDLVNTVVSPLPDAAIPMSSRSLANRITYSEDNQDHGCSNENEYAGSQPRPQQGRLLQQRIAVEHGFEGDGGPVQSDSLHAHRQDEARHINNDSRAEADMEVDDFADLFAPDPPPPRPPRELLSTKPIQYGSSHDLPFNLHLHPPRPVQAATSREPIRMLTTFGTPESDLDDPAPSSVVASPPAPKAKATDAKKHPVNTYRGNDPIKRRVQNKKLQLILMGRPLPKPRKKADRMVLKCTGKQEFR